jgi:hypothetical protein
LKRRKRSFNVGDKVWVRNHQLSNAETSTVQKFLPKCIGPYQILSKFQNTYTLDLEPQKIPKRHISDLKPFFERENTTNFPIAMQEKLLDENPKIPVVRQLRAKSRIDYRRLAGHRN